MCLISGQYLLIGSRDKKPFHNTYYLILLDFLINTRKDVDLLCDKKILVNYLGDNNAIKSMINNLNKDIIWSGTRDDYIDLCKELNGFYKNPWHKREDNIKK